MSQTNTVPLTFTKMHGLSNDFVLIEAIARPVSLTSAQVKLIAHRRRGIGCDQILVVETAYASDAHFRYRVYNADGGEVEQCGNGARCVARYLRERGLIKGAHAKLETAAGIFAIKFEEDGQITIDMGVPRLAPELIPFVADTQGPTYRLKLDDIEVELSAVSMGNPHAVMRVKDVKTAPVATLGPLVETHPCFPNRTNVGFMHVIDRGSVRLRVFERGVGETMACGTGACAAVVAGRLQGWLDERVTVELPGGRLVISWQGQHAPVLMTGQATKVFEGSIDL
jgi:diaminopimelate epimerase